MEDEKLEQNSETESEESENSSMEYEISNNESDEDLVNFSEISLDDVGTIDSFNQDLEDACSVFSSIYSYAGIDINARDNKEETEDKDLADFIIQAFTRRPRVNFIDADADDNALVSYQESEARLINLGILTSTVLVTVSTILLIQALFQDQYQSLFINQCLK